MSTQKIRSMVVSAFFVMSLLAVQCIHTGLVFADVTDDVFLTSNTPRVTSDTTGSFSIMSMSHLPVECKVDSGAFAPCASNPFTTSALQEGPHTFTVHTIGATNPESTATYSWTITSPPVLVGGTAVTGAVGSLIHISDLQIDDSGNDTVSVKLSAANGILSLHSTTGITFSGNTTGSTLVFSGTRSNMNTALATLLYAPAKTGTYDIDAYILGANGDDYSTINGHVFKLVHTGTGVTWSQAKAAAEATEYGGAAGYLASITSTQENEFINQRISNTSWVGGNDTSTEGDWMWSGGPQDGTSFWNGDTNGSTVNGAFVAWRGGMPDNYNEEDCLEIEANSTGSATWNDQNCNQAKFYYVVEYGDGNTIPYAAKKQIAITATPAPAATAITASSPTSQATTNIYTAVASPSYTDDTTPTGSATPAKTTGKSHASKPIDKTNDAASKPVRFTRNLPIAIFGLMLLLALWSIVRKHRLDKSD